MDISNSDISPRPWSVGDWDTVVDADGNDLAKFDSEAYVPDAANAAHAVACVNACEGMDPADVRGMAERLREAERIVNEMGPVCMTVLMACGDSIGSDERTRLKRVIAEAATFVASNRSHD